MTKHAMTKRVARLLFLVVLISLSIAFLWQFGPSQATQVPHLDKAVHFAAFFILAFTFHRAFPVPIWIGLPLLVLYGIAIEYAQSLTPYRSGDGWDLVADAAGVVGYYLVNAAVVHWRKKRQA